MWRTLKAIFYKELIDAVRDKRALRLAFLPPVYMVVFFALGIGFAIHLQKEVRSNIELNVSGHAPELIAWLEENQIKIKRHDIDESDKDLYQAVESGDLDMGLSLPIEPQAPGAKEPLPVTLVYNAANQNVHGPLGTVRNLIYQFSSRHAAINVMARGLSPELMAPVRIKETNVASDQQMGGLILAGVPLLLLMSAMMGSMGFAADMTAGERERRSLEPLLINPTSSSLFITGKWLAAVSLTLSVVALTLVLLSIALALLPFNQMGFRVDVGVMAVLSIFWSLIPVAMIAAALQLALGILSRSFKDAQTYMSLLVLLPMIPFFIVMTSPGIYADWQLWVPLLGHQTVLKDLLLGDAAPSWAFTAFWLSAVPVVLLALGFAGRQLRRAKVIYG
ncbi:ABC transporter permease [Gilvimarinus polysaccharolyticus]|uniref:ABC transporter permease n=1 Tax=Gilvimarinus polysaccharolyticus TaxID=863921 RepID=UPI0006734865|nr:ABC transporter permease [Gilvimarinus polysaccharolyticus]